jgi:hypothetical protein
MYSGLSRRPRLAPCSLASLIALAGLGFAGAVLWLIGPRSPSASSLALASQILVFDPKSLHPKPRDQFVYLGLILLSPILVGAAAWLARRRTNLLGGTDVVAVVATLGATAWLLARDPLTAPIAAKTLPFVLAAPVGLALAFLELRAAPTVVTVLKRALFATLCVAAVALCFVWRVTDGEGAAGTLYQNHLGAFLYSIVQIYHGATCTVDLPTQYGCYGEFYLPLLKAVGLNVAKITVINATLLSIALIAVLAACHRLIRSPMLFLACGLTVLVLNNPLVFPGLIDPYFQYTPLRVLFPALSLPLALRWAERPSLRGAAGLGVFGAFAVLWNADSGIVVFGALGLLALFGRPAPVGVAVKTAVLYGLAACATLALAWAGLSIHGRGVSDLTMLVRYAGIFSTAGFLLLPTAAPPALWTLAAGTAAIAMTLAALKRLQGRAQPRDIVCAYAGVLGTGLLSYYFGRSHPYTFAACVWPLAMVGFVLLDGLDRADTAPAKTIAILCRATAAAACVGLALAFATSWPTFKDIVKARWTPILHADPQNDAGRRLDFIRREANHQPFDVFSTSQALIHAETSTAATLPGPGLDEVLLKPDAARDVDFLIRSGPAHFFVDYDSLMLQTATFQTTPWLLPALPRLRQVYALKNWSADGSLMHLVRKPYAGADLFDWKTPASPLDPLGRVPTKLLSKDARSGKLVSVWARPVGPDWITEPGKAFMVTVKVNPAAAQPPYAALVSTHGAALAGVVIFAMPGSSPAWVLGVGDGTKYINSKPFDIPAGRTSVVSLYSSRGLATVTVDGKVVAGLAADRALPFAPAALPLTLGDWIGHDRPFAGTIEEAFYYDDTPPRSLQRTH